LSAHTQNLDSLKAVLQKTPQDSHRVKLLYTLAQAYLGKNPVESIQYAKELKCLGKQLHDTTYYIKAFNQVGIGYILLGEYNQAVAELVAGLRLADSVQNHSLQGYLNLNIGLVYSKLQNIKEALKHYKAGLKHGLVVQDPRITVVSYSNIGYTYISEKKYTQATQALQEGLKLAIAAKDVKNQGLIYSNLAMIYCQQKQYAQAEQTFIKSIDLSKKAKDSFTILGTYVDFIQFYLDTDKTDLVPQHLQEALQLAKDIGGKNFEANLYELYTQYYKKLGKFEQALLYKEKAIVLKDSVFSIKKNKEITQIKANYRHEAEKLRLKQQVALEKKARQTQKTISVIALIACVAIIIVALLLHVANQKRRKTNKQLAVQKLEAEKQRDIIEENTMEMQAAYHTLQTMHEELKQTQSKIATQRDELQFKNEKLSWYRYRIGKSIEAAKMIQTAILPDPACLAAYFQEYFVLYKPKDVVSGDFYWVDHQQAHTILIAADCTGHGVPGAFMSMVANTLLDDIVKVNKVHDPATILDLLHKKIQKALRQEDTRNNSGMDVAAVMLEQIDTDQTQVTFAGARRPLLYVRQGTHTLQELKGTRQPIGGIQPKRKTFEQHILPLPTGSLLYVGSDGLIDQNDEARNKFGSIRLKNILQANAHLSLAQQQDALETELQSYMQGIEQRDDILWMGVKL
jgi:serine phosphatase RsbU (regulator of sigma subunit)/tetratricopeptide (TPR) repeat protein